MDIRTNMEKNRKINNDHKVHEGKLMYGMLGVPPNG